MAKDDRLYAKFTLDFPDHAKILPLSDAAFRCLVEATLYSRKHLTDGLLARRYALARWSLEVLRELCDNDPEKPSLIECEEGWRIHDFADIQDTRAEVEARRERNRKAGQQGGLAKAKRGAKRLASDSLSENVAETETETETLTTSVVTYVGAESVKAPAKPTPRKRGTRITDPHWMPQTTTVDRIKAAFPHVTREQLSHEHERFICWATGSASSNAVKLDWEATWSGWMRRELVKLPTANGIRPSKTDQGIRETQSLKSLYPVAPLALEELA